MPSKVAHSKCNAQKLFTTQLIFSFSLPNHKTSKPPSPHFLSKVGLRAGIRSTSREAVTRSLRLAVPGKLSTCSLWCYQTGYFRDLLLILLDRRGGRALDVVSDHRIENQRLHQCLVTCGQKTNRIVKVS